MNEAMRTSLLINLSAKEAVEIRKRASADMRSVSGYVIFMFGEISTGKRETHSLFERRISLPPKFLP
jgi:hypothetical protein